jgi:long-chain acyl-CoA synthetase
MNVSSQTVRDTFNKAFSQNSNKSFIVFKETKITYGELRNIIPGYTTYFSQNGIKQGDRVLFSSKDERFLCLFYLALIANGITAVFIDPDCGSERARAIIKHCQSNIIFIDPDIIRNWNLEKDDHLKITQILQENEKRLFQRLISRDKKTTLPFPGCISELYPTNIPEKIDPLADAYILFTSGTTSEPKGVRISYRALFSHLSTLSNVYKTNNNSRFFNNLILSHTDGMTQGPLLALFNSATVYRPFPFSIQRIEDIFDIVFRENITHWVMVPTIMALIYQYKQNDTDTLNNTDFKYVISCAGKLEAKLWQQFEEKFKTRIINGYGLTETVTGGIFAGPDDDSHIIGTLGKPVDCEAKIMGEDNNEKQVGEEGEIWLRGSLLMSGYLNAPEANNEVFADGWLKTGDYGFKGDDGCFRITGRKKLLIISGGINVSPDEVTEVLRSHPSVQDAVTFGLEDDIWGEIVACAIVVKNQATLSIEQVTAYCRLNMEERKVPSKVYFVEQFPYGPSGKVIVQSIKNMISDKQSTDLLYNDTQIDFFKIVSGCLRINVENLTMDFAAEDNPEWDSISHLMLITEMEKHFKIEFLPLEVMNVKSLADLYSIIEYKTKP